MPDRKPNDAQIVSVRLPRDLIQRLDRYLDWKELYGKAKSSRNAAIRQALSAIALKPPCWLKRVELGPLIIYQ